MANLLAASCVDQIFALFEAGTRNDSEIFKRLRPTFTTGEIFTSLQQVRRQRWTTTTTQTDPQASPTSTATTPIIADPELEHLHASLHLPESSLHTLTVRGLSPLIYACSVYDEELGLLLL